MNRLFSRLRPRLMSLVPLIPLMTGLFAAQIISTCLVYTSNLHLLKKMTALRNAGWLTVPNSIVTETLNDVAPAFFGGLFFTFTIGLFLSLITLLAARAKPNRTYPRRYIFSALAAGIWGSLLILININGVNVWASSYILLIPPVVFLVSTKYPTEKTALPKHILAGHLVCLMILGIVGAYRLPPSAFSNIRDNLLLSNPAGLVFNNFYYRYTLYPAQVFKSLEQSQIRSVKIAADLSPKHLRRVRRALVRYDYLPVPANADILLAGDWKRMTFSIGNRIVFKTSGQYFAASPKKVLTSVSQRGDRWKEFRQLTFLALCVVSGVTAYLMLYLPFRLILGFFFKNKAGHISMACGVAAGVILIWFWQPGSIIENAAVIDKLLQSDSLRDKLIPLKSVRRRSSRFDELAGQFSRSHTVAERYWLVRALVYYDNKKVATPILTRMIDDPQINVAYRAMYALGIRKERRAVKKILKKIETSDHWYFQMYAYKTLRRLGWMQTESR